MPHPLPVRPLACAAAALLTVAVSACSSGAQPRGQHIGAGNAPDIVRYKSASFLNYLPILVVIEINRRHPAVGKAALRYPAVSCVVTVAAGCIVVAPCPDEAVPGVVDGVGIGHVNDSIPIVVILRQSGDGWGGTGDADYLILAVEGPHLPLRGRSSDITRHNLPIAEGV